MIKNRWAALAYLLLVFGSGTMVGAVAHRLYMATSVTASVAPKTPAQARTDFLDKLRKRVGASDDQIFRVNAALDEAKRRYSDLDLQDKPLRDKIDQERIAAVVAILNPEQGKIYLAWRAEVRAKREQEAKAQKAQTDGAATQPNPAPQSR